MWRILNAMCWLSVTTTVGHPRVARGAPRVQHPEHVSARVVRDAEPGAHCPRTLPPREKDGGWGVAHRAFERGAAGLVARVVSPVADDHQRVVPKGVAVAAVVERRTGTPELVRS